MVAFTKPVKQHPYISDLTLNIKEGQEAPTIGSRVKIEVQNKSISCTAFIPVHHFIDNDLAVIKQ